MIDAETGLPYSFAPDASSTPQSAAGISPLLLALMQQQGGPGMQQLLQYFINGPGAVSTPAAAEVQPGAAQQQPSAPLGYGGTQPDPLTAQQRAFLGYGGPGQPVDWYAATGLPGGMNNGAQGPGWAGGQAAAQPIYQAQPSAQASTPQDFVTQWRQMFGSK